MHRWWMDALLCMVSWIMFGVTLVYGEAWARASGGLQAGHTSTVIYADVSVSVCDLFVLYN